MNNKNSPSANQPRSKFKKTLQNAALIGTLTIGSLMLKKSEAQTTNQVLALCEKNREQLSQICQNSCDDLNDDRRSNELKKQAIIDCKFQTRHKKATQQKRKNKKRKRVHTHSTKSTNIKKSNPAKRKKMNITHTQTTNATNITQQMDRRIFNAPISKEDKEGWKEYLKELLKFLLTFLASVSGANYLSKRRAKKIMNQIIDGVKGPDIINNNFNQELSNAQEGGLEAFAQLLGKHIADQAVDSDVLKEIIENINLNQE